MLQSAFHEFLSTSHDKQQPLYLSLTSSGLSLRAIGLPLACWKTVETDVVLSPRGFVPALTVEKWLLLLRLIHWKRLKRISPWNSQLSCRSRSRCWRCSLCPVGLQSLGLLLVHESSVFCAANFHFIGGVICIFVVLIFVYRFPPDRRWISCAYVFLSRF